MISIEIETDGIALSHHSFLGMQVQKDMNPIRKGLHWIGVVISILIGIVASIAAVRYIVVDAVNYHVFANISG